MASTIEATWGGTAADSYISQEDADDLIAKYAFETTLWDASDEDKKDQLLRMATRRIDMLNFYGHRLSSTQSLQWPRTINFCMDVTDDQVLADVQLATVLEALDLVSRRGSKRHEQNIADGLKQVSESVGPIRDQYTYTGGAATLLCTDATRIMSKYVQSKKLYRA